MIANSSPSDRDVAALYYLRAYLLACPRSPGLALDQAKAGGEAGGLHRPYPSDGGGRISIER